MRRCKYCGIELKPIKGLYTDREYCVYDARLKGVDIGKREDLTRSKQ